MAKSREILAQIRTELTALGLTVEVSVRSPLTLPPKTALVLPEQIERDTSPSTATRKTLLTWIVGTVQQQPTATGHALDEALEFGEQVADALEDSTALRAGGSLGLEETLVKGPLRFGALPEGQSGQVALFDLTLETTWLEIG